ncbi:hypothetical protein M0811_05458 [Anaeramoeba ignava]|uniref:Transposase n=1 Tax=Anaeramoeba ignava TaxID=1746090 RepID=A0A9Q0LUN4_ANAIG|nr:hypothetical protein M0811_05458 [Anaeramoeba ignava]
MWNYKYLSEGIKNSNGCSERYNRTFKSRFPKGKVPFDTFFQVIKNEEDLWIKYVLAEKNGVLQHLMTIESAKECFEFEIPFLFDIRFDRFYTSQEEKQLFDNELEISYVLFSFPIFFSIFKYIQLEIVLFFFFFSNKTIKTTVPQNSRR